MSSYRDDSHDIAVASDSTWAGLTSIVEDTAKAVATLIVCIGVLHTDSAVASDQVIDRSSHMIVEQAQASDTVTDHLLSKQLVIEKAKVKDGATGRLRTLLEDSAVASDLVFDKQLNIIVERATASDEVTGQRRAKSLVVDKARAFDTLVNRSSVLVEDTATANDWAGGKLKRKDLIAEIATAGDLVVDDHHAIAPVVVEGAKASDEVIDRLYAKDLIKEVVVTEDEALSIGGDYGQAWTANADNWAMSRYAPYSFRRLAVVDGVLYGLADDGVYALSGGVEEIQGSVTTGKLDVGGGGLVHPVSAYLEYELEGTAEMDVTTTQSGLAQTFTYPLAAEVANELTNGRFIFGRGLRGRHFSFTLRIKGLAGYINDLSVTSTPTKRRV